MNSTSTTPQGGAATKKTLIVVPLAAALNMDGFALGEPDDYIHQSIKIHQGFSAALGLSFDANGARVISTSTAPRMVALKNSIRYSSFEEVALLFDPPILVVGSAPSTICGIVVSNKTKSVVALGATGGTVFQVAALACLHVGLPSHLQSPSSLGPLQSMPTPVMPRPPAAAPRTLSGKGWPNFFTGKSISIQRKKLHTRRQRRVTEKMRTVTVQPVKLSKREISAINKQPGATHCVGCEKEMPFIVGTMRACLKCEN